MATERIMLRLSDKDATEAEIIAILRGKADGRKAPWLREVLVEGYRAMREAGRSLPLVSPEPPAVAPVTEVDKDQPQVIAPASQSKESVAESHDHSSTPAALSPAVSEHRKTKKGDASALAGLTGYGNER